MIDQFINLQKAQGRSEGTIKTYSKVLMRLNKFKPLEQITKEDLTEYLKKFDCTDSTRSYHVVVIKMFFASIGKPEIANWIKVKKPKETLKSDDILTGEDINKLLDATDSPYWKALISVLYESGARINEVRNLRYKDLEERSEGTVIHIKTTKTAAGFRKMILIESAQYLKNLRAKMNPNPDDVIFKLNYRYSFEVLEDIGRRAGLKKRCNPHSFRHARATNEVIKGTQEAIIRKLLGWAPNSTMISRYQHLSDEAVIEAQLGHANKTKLTPMVRAEKFDVSTEFDEIRQENETLKAELQAQKEQNDFIMRALKDKGIL